MSSRLELARAVAEAVTALPGVYSMTAGPGVPVVTLSAHGQVPGVRGSDERVTVAVVAARLPLAPVAAAVGQAAEAVLAERGDTRRVDVVIGDVTDTALRSASTGYALLPAPDGGERCLS
ncbi:hypothetical protein [Catellatospora sichuanensis]|uniref:hypothetical protein n=1 Tax=Catellatospora sichuanensis TaxID=1969805 RepID=UPI0011837A9F|nr:hypothetical protein [Catellatospora sichuanensis]